VSLVSGEDRTFLRDIERLIGRKIEQQIVPGFEPGAGYHTAQPEPQQRRGERKSLPSPSGRGRERSERMRASRQPQPAAQPRQRQAPRRDHAQGRRQEHRAAPATPSEKVRRSVQREQLEHHRRQQADEQRSEAASAPERVKDEPLPARFGLVRRKVA